MNRAQFLASSVSLLALRKAPPMSADITYSDSRSTILDGTGAGSVTFNGPPSLTTRELSNVVVSCSSSVPRPTCRLYRSVVAPNRLMGSTFLGDGDTMVADPGDTLGSGEPLIIVWSGGLAGATCYANANGTDHRA
jgi:hypothetical protein